MKFSVNSDDLRVATNHARSIVLRGHSSPVLANILIEADENSVVFRVTDLQVEMEINLDAKVSEQGAATVSANILGELSQRLSTGIAVEFTYDQISEKIRILAGATDGDLLTLPVDDFPSKMQSEEEISFSVESKVLHRLFEMTKHSVSDESPRKYLQGVFLHGVDLEGGKFLRCVSSDGFQLSRVDAIAPLGCENIPNMLVPLKAVQEVIKMLKNAPETVQISASASKITFSTPTITFSSRLINAEFPNYNKLIPELAGIRMVIDADTCLSALGRMLAVIPREGSAVSMEIANDNLNLSVSSPNSGTIQENIPVAFPHEKLKIKFSHAHMMGMFSLLSNCKVNVDFQSTPGATRFATDSDLNALFIVMPIRV